MVESDLPSPERGAIMISVYSRFLDAIKKRPAWGIPSDEPEVEREIWESIENALRIYTQSPNYESPFPHEIAAFVASALSELLSGGLPISWRVLAQARIGAPKASSSEQGCKRVAMLYRRACEVGLIPDRSPSKTIADAYGVGTRTVRDWRRLFYDEHLNPGAIQPDKDEETNTRLIVSMMQSSAREYRASVRARSKKAIASRPKKRAR